MRGTPHGIEPPPTRTRAGRRPRAGLRRRLLLPTLTVVALGLAVASRGEPPARATAREPEAHTDTLFQGGVVRAASPALEALRRAKLLAGEGDHLAQKGDFPAARRKWHDALDAFHLAGDGLGEADACSKLGYSFLLSGEFLTDPKAADAAMDYFIRSLLAASEVYEKSVQKELSFDREALERGQALFDEALASSKDGACKEALPLFEQAQRTYHAAGFGSGEVRTLALEARCRLEAGDLPGALAAALKAIPIAQALPLGNPTTELFLDAQEKAERGELESARAAYLEALKRYENAGDPTAEQVRLDLGALDAKRGDAAAAEAELRRALAGFERSDDEYSRENRAAAHHDLGGLAIQTHRTKEAIPELETALGIWRSIGRPEREMATLTALGFALGEQGRLAEAEETLEKARALSDRLSPDPVAEADLFNNLASVHYRQGHYQKALADQHRALDLKGGQGDPRQIMGFLANLASFESSLGDLSEADSTLERVEKLAEKGAGDGSLAPLGNNRAALLARAGLTGKAREELERALSQLPAGSDPGVSSIMLGNLGLFALSDGDPAQAESQIERALELAEHVDRPALRVRLWSALGLIRCRQKRFDEALDLAGRALDLATTTKDPIGRLFAQLTLSFAHFQNHEIEPACDGTKALVNDLEELQGGITIPDLKASFLGQLPFQAIYGLDAFCSLSQGHAERAFGDTERARARAFLARVAASGVDPPTGVPENLLQDKKQLEARLRFLQERWLSASAASPSGDLDLRQELDDARARYARFLVRLRLTDPSYASLVTPEPVSLAELQGKLLPEETTLVEYFVLAGGRFGSLDVPVLAWVIDRERVSSRMLEITGSELERQAELLRAQITSRDPAARDTATELYRRLVTPLEPEIRHRNLLLALHGPLHYVPFAALLDPSTGLYLSEEYVLSHIPSASLLRFLTAPRTGGGEPLLAFGDPDGTLPWAAQEVEAVASLYGVHSAVGSAATEARFRRLAPGARRLHLATHGLLDPTRPLFSRIELAPGEGQDGHLEIREIFGLDLHHTDLVVLSACETRLGKVTSGDEITSLSRSFLAAGASHVIASLWPVDDLATARLMEELYRGLRQGLTKGQALRRAQTAVRREHPEPYFWAGFELTGVE